MIKPEVQVLLQRLKDGDNSVLGELIDLNRDAFAA